MVPVNGSTTTTVHSHVNQFSSTSLSASSPCFYSQFETTTTTVSYQKNGEKNDEEKENVQNDGLSSLASSSSSLAPYPSPSIFDDASNENISAEFYEPEYFKRTSHCSTSSGTT